MQKKVSQSRLETALSGLTASRLNHSAVGPYNLFSYNQLCFRNSNLGHAESVKSSAKKPFKQ